MEREGEVTEELRLNPMNLALRSWDINNETWSVRTHPVAIE